VPRVTLYGKAGCCLCDEARAAIRDVSTNRDFELVEVDVAADPGLHARYGERIPVVTVDGDEAFEHRVDPDELRDLLDRVAS
jgi:glutaredoxin